jgi:hypothetical protein
MGYEAKTKASEVEVDGFIAGSPKPKDGAALCALMRKVSGLEPRMWGPSIVGFGEREYDLAGGKTGRMLAIGFSPRKTSLVIYIKHAAGMNGWLGWASIPQARAASTSTGWPMWTPVCWRKWSPPPGTRPNGSNR